MHKTVVLDTNFFFHSQSMDQIEWTELLGVSTVTLVIPSVVLSELDQKKHDTSARMRGLSKDATTKLRRLRKESDGKLRNNVQVEQFTDIGEIDFQKLRLNASHPDDQILGFALTYRDSKSIPNDEFILLTADYLMESKAEERGLNVYELPKEYARVPELDESAKELRALRAENEKLKNRIPKIVLLFNGEARRAQMAFGQHVVMNEEEVNERVSKRKLEHPHHDSNKLKIERTSVSGPHIDSLKAFTKMIENATAAFQPTQKDWDAYNSSLNEFYQNAEKFDRDQIKHFSRLNRTCFLDIDISNVGTSVASNINIWFHFPDGFTLVEASHVESEREPPIPPRKPEFRAVFDALNGMPCTNSFYLPDLRIDPNPQPINIRSSGIRSTKSYEIDYEVQRLAHHHKEHLGSFALVFDSAQAATNFQIQIRVTCDELLLPIELSVPAIFDK